jgi:hypothetical protein
MAQLTTNKGRNKRKKANHPIRLRARRTKQGDTIAQPHDPTEDPSTGVGKLEPGLSPLQQLNH